MARGTYISLIGNMSLMLSVYEELAEASRRAILGELRSGPKSVGEIVEATQLRQPNVSNHLARLRTKGIVKASKEGRQVYYSLASAEIESAVGSVFAPAEVPSALPDYECLAKRYAKSAISGDESGCADILELLVRHQVPLIEIYQDVLAMAMTLVGTWYQVEAIDEGQEHMASAITERMMAKVAHAARPLRQQSKVAVLGCPPGNHHVIGLRMVSDYLRLLGWTTIYLGADVPIPAFLVAVAQHQPDLVLLNCATVDTVEATLQLIHELRTACPRRGGYLIGVGGTCLEKDADPFMAAGADFWSRDLKSFADEIVAKIDRVVPNSPTSAASTGR